MRMFARIAVVGVVLLVGAPVAHADSQDDRYLAALAVKASQVRRIS